MATAAGGRGNGIVQQNNTESHSAAPRLGRGTESLALGAAWNRITRARASPSTHCLGLSVLIAEMRPRTHWPAVVNTCTSSST